MKYLDSLLLCDFIAVNPISAITLVLNLQLLCNQDYSYCRYGGGGVGCRGGDSSDGGDRFTCGSGP